MSKFQKATKKQAKLRLALIGPSGSGKTYTALSVATGLGTRIALIDTEHGSASKYSDRFAFDVLELDSYAPERYIEGITDAAANQYDVLIIDSLSHAWAGKDGILEFVDKRAKATDLRNNFGAWRDATPKHNALVDAILAAPLHIIVTVRAKTEYVLEKDERTGKQTPRKIGLQPVQRDGLEYEFDVVGDMKLEDNTLVVSKTRCPQLAGEVIRQPGAPLAELLKGWLTDGVAPSYVPPHVQALADTVSGGRQETTGASAQEARTKPRLEKTAPEPAAPTAQQIADELSRVASAAPLHVAQVNTHRKVGDVQWYAIGLSDARTIYTQKPDVVELACEFRDQQTPLSLTTKKDRQGNLIVDHFAAAIPHEPARSVPASVDTVPF